MKEQLRIGQRGANLLSKLLRQSGLTIEQHTKPHYQMNVEDGSTIWCFTERNSTDNFAFEWWDDKESKKPGWAQKLLNAKSPPTHICFVTLNENEDNLPSIQFLNTKALIEYLLTHNHTMKPIHREQHNETWNQLVPRWELEKLGVVTMSYKKMGSGFISVKQLRPSEPATTLEQFAD